MMWSILMPFAIGYLMFEKCSPIISWLIKTMQMPCLPARLVLLATLNGNAIYDGFPVVLRRISPRAKTVPQKIKVLRLIARLNVGGPAIHVHLLTTGLDSKRFETLLVAGTISDKEGNMAYLFQDSTHQPYQLSEMRRDIRIPMDIRVIRRIYQLIRKFQPDIVHTHTAKAGFTARITVLLYNLIFRKNIKIVHTFHGHVFNGYFGRAMSCLFIQIERLLARMTDVIIAISKTQRNDLVKKYHIAPLEKIREIELGFDLKPFLSCAALKGGFREKLGVGEETLLVGIIGRLAPIKNHAMFFKAASLFLKSSPDIDVKFVVVGDGECRQQLEAYCSVQHLTRHVVFCGWIQDISRVYADLNILALTSLNEGTPVSMIEAMAASVPVIATQVGGIQDLMGKPDHSAVAGRGFTVCERGIFSQNNDPEGFSRGLSYLVREDFAVRQARIQRARTYVTQRYAAERLLQDIDLLYTQLMN
jgi:glycosyltransferase involved in cell wall biosynthesis